MLKNLRVPKIDASRLPPHAVELVLFASAALILVWVSWLTWIDVTQWSKDLGNIFFGSRTDQPISLGIGMTVMHYFVIGLVLFAVGAVMLLRSRIWAMKPQHAILMELQKMRKENGVKCSSEAASLTNVGKAAAGEEQLFLGCPYHFGYLSSRPEDSDVPQKCMICQRLGDCMVATVYVKKLGK